MHMKTHELTVAYARALGRAPQRRMAGWVSTHLALPNLGSVSLLVSISSEQKGLPVPQLTSHFVAGNISQLLKPAPFPEGRNTNSKDKVHLNVLSPLLSGTERRAILLWVTTDNS